MVWVATHTQITKQARQKKTERREEREERQREIERRAKLQPMFSVEESIFL